MKILHIIISCFYIEGAGYQENILSRMHKESGHEVTIITKSTYYDKDKQAVHRNSTAYYNSDGVKVIILPDNPNRTWGKISRGRLGFLDNVSSGLYDTICSEKPDIIMEHGVSVSDTKDIAKYVKLNTTVKFYIDQHGDYYNTPLRYPRLSDTILSIIKHKVYFRHLVKMISPYVNYYWGTTPWRVDYLRKVYSVPEAKSGLLIMGGDDSFIDWHNREAIRKECRLQLDLQDDDFLVITGGKIDKAKNIHLLVEAIASLDNPKVKLAIFGMPVNEMKKIFENTADKYINIGWIDSNSVYKWFLTADLAVFPGTHSVLWEQAASCGIPLVCKRWNGMQHINVDGNCTFIDGEGIDDVKNTISNIIFDKNCYDLMQKKALEVRNNFLYSKISEKAISK